MELLYISFFIILAYLIGSVPTSVWIGRAFYGIDVRHHGSKNAGATNTFRVLGIKAGIPVLIIDVLKGWCAVKLIVIYEYYFPGSGDNVGYQIILGAGALIGHIFPIYVGFKGGKGVASMLGIVIAIHPTSALIAMGIFVVVLLISRYVSLSSIIAGLSFPVLIITLETNLTLHFFALTVSVLLLMTHQKNIERLFKGEEKRANLFKKKK